MLELTALVETREGVRGRVWSRHHQGKTDFYSIKLDDGTIKQGYAADELKKIGGTLDRIGFDGKHIPAEV